RNILFIGRLEKEKGIFETIKTFKLIKNKNITLNIIGYGVKEIENKIFNLIKKDKRIFFHGKLYGEEKENIIKKTDLFIFPSYYPEGQPVTITEIVLNNIPIITTDVGNNKEIYGDNLIYVKKQNIDDLKNKIEWIINNIENYKYNYSEALKKIDINNITNQFLNLK
ncbi:glycosyltransferase family 4 protein, partial [Candidatus Gracilibacteria bacterium]|nr:glycosyltransferase family 4 protein [Candidatus Gracilibacteria bacterium]